MTKSINLGIPNGVLFIRDRLSRDFPEMEGKGWVWSTPSFITLMCLHEQEGETQVTIGRSSDVRESGELMFDGVLETPSREIVVDIVPGEPILIANVDSEKTRVRIFGNAGRHSDDVAIALS